MAKIFLTPGEEEQAPFPRPELPKGAGVPLLKPRAPPARPKAKRKKPSCYVVTCPRCQAGFGVGCFSKTGWRKRFMVPHEERVRTWERRRDQVVDRPDRGG